MAFCFIFEAIMVNFRAKQLRSTLISYRIIDFVRSLLVPLGCVNYKQLMSKNVVKLTNYALLSMLIKTMTCQRKWKMSIYISRMKLLNIREYICIFWAKTNHVYDWKKKNPLNRFEYIIFTFCYCVHMKFISIVFQLPTKVEKGFHRIKELSKMFENISYVFRLAK